MSDKKTAQAEEQVLLSKDRLIELGFEEANGYMWYEWFPFGLKLIEDEECLDGTEINPYWGLYVGRSLLLTKLITETHLYTLFKAHRVVMPKNICQLDTTTLTAQLKELREENERLKDELKKKDNVKYFKSKLND